jgi:MOSC domain-containing protein YiiM
VPHAKPESHAPRIEALYLADAARGPVRPVPEATAVPGRGLLGDRYERGAGTFSDWPKDHELTLVEAEVLEDLARHHDVHFAPGETRRNLTTRNVRLNDLVGRRFGLGPDVECEGTRLCEPCDHLEAVTGRPNLCRVMAHRGGLRARILTGGTIRVGDRILTPSQSTSDGSREEENDKATTP